MQKKWSREAFEKKFGSVEWSQNKNTPEVVLAKGIYPV